MEPLLVLFCKYSTTFLLDEKMYMDRGLSLKEDISQKPVQLAPKELDVQYLP